MTNEQESQHGNNEGARTPRQMGRLGYTQAKAIKEKIAAGEAGQYEAAILWQELERIALGAAVSASPQPRCPKCQSGNIDFTCSRNFACCRDCHFYTNEGNFAQFFAAAPAQEPRKKRLMVTPTGGVHEWCPECVGICAEHKAAHEQPVENSTRFKDFDDVDHPCRKWWNEHGQYMMSGGGRRDFIWACRGWIAREQLAEGVDVTGDSLHEDSPQKGKP